MTAVIGEEIAMGEGALAPMVAMVGAPLVAPVPRA